MARRNIGSLRPVIQAAISGAGLLGGVAVGAWIVFGTGLLDWAQKVLDIPLESIILPAALMAIVFGLGWLGLTVGLATARKIAP
jgi:hypothetical protein